jgi:hypothetical protein
MTEIHHSKKTERYSALSVSATIPTRLRIEVIGVGSSALYGRLRRRAEKSWRVGRKGPWRPSSFFQAMALPNLTPTCV